jgi:hypothetical protein
MSFWVILKTALSITFNIGLILMIQLDFFPFVFFHSFEAMNFPNCECHIPTDLGDME